MRTLLRGLAAGAFLAAVLLAGPAAAQTVRGPGTGRSADTPPPTQDDGPPRERALGYQRPWNFDPRPGLLGAAGAAHDYNGATPLGPRVPRTARPTYGPGGEPAWSEANDTWRAGDRVRSAGSADVRSARRQEAPDLEWAQATPSREPAAAPAQPAAAPARKAGGRR